MEILQRRGTIFDESEMQNVRNVHNLLSEVGTEVNAQTSLAAELTRFWASFYDDTWVWGGKSASFLIILHVFLEYVDGFDFSVSTSLWQSAPSLIPWMN